MGVRGGRKMRTQAGIWAGALIAALIIVAPAGAADQPQKDDRPARGIGLYSEYSGVVVPLGETVRMELTVEAKGKQDEVVNLKIASAPKGWKACRRTAKRRPTTPSR